MNIFARIVSLLIIGLARGYQLFLSPVLPRTCRYQPTCSAYAIDAVSQYGAARGSLLLVRRILRCHPWGGNGYDPVPEKDRL